MAAGFYLYCLKEADEARPPIKASGVDGKGEVFIFAVGSVDAVVSRVDTDDFGTMRKKAQEDIHWIKEKALAHEMVVEEAMGLSAEIAHKRASWIGTSEGMPLAADSCRLWQSGLTPVIPVKFGVIFNNAKRLAEVIGDRNAAIKAAFDRIRAKQEWSVKLFLNDNRNFKDRIREQSELLREKSKALAALPAGMAYFMEVEFNEDLERECSRRLDEEAMKTFEELKPFAAEAALVKILDDKLTGRKERMVLNSACLVEDSRLLKFEEAVATMREKSAKHGFLLELSGPWPPYHFTEFANECSL